MRRVALAIAYDGAAFDSYARQPGRRTVEGELLDTLRASVIVGDARQARFLSGSRTDARVSAAWNVVAFDAEADSGPILAAGMRAPSGLVLLSAVRVDGDFNPRHAARRVYRYALSSEVDFDWARARRAAHLFVGAHDFSNFSRTEPHRNPVRTIERIRFLRGTRGPALEVSAPSFAWQQVRRIVAALVRVSQGKLAPADVRGALKHPRHKVDYGLAPAEPLLLVRVDYDTLRFPPPPKAVRARLEEERRRAERSAQVYATALGASSPRTRR